MRRNRAIILICITLFVALAARLYDLDEIPGEWYGDISIVQRYTADILALKWPFYYALSAGPLYHYLIAPVIAVFGHTYLSYKLASVAVSILAMGAMMLLGYEIGGFRLSLATGLLSAVSSWFLVFSRLGNSQIAIPLLTALTGYFLVRFIKTGKTTDAVLGAIASAVGLYSYPQTFIMPLVFLLILATYTWAYKGYKGKALRLSMVFACLLVILVMALPFLAIVLRQPDNFRTGYVGGKLVGSGEFAIQDFAVGLGENLWVTLQMLHVRGDGLFRSNPPSLPHLDILSGIFLILGLLRFLVRDSRRYVPLFLMSILLLIVPASWPFLPPDEIPSASRTIGIMPFVYVLSANGLVWMHQMIRGKDRDDKPVALTPALNVDGVRRTAAQAMLGVVIVLVVLLNIHRYFVSYAWNLPNHNVAYGRTIAQEIDSLPNDVSVYVGGCCWGDWGQPEPEGIRYQLKVPRQVTFITLPEIPLDELRSDRTSKHFFWDPRDEAEGFVELLQALPGGQVEERRDEHGDIIYLEYIVGGTNGPGRVI